MNTGDCSPKHVKAKAALCLISMKEAGTQQKGESILHVQPPQHLLAGLHLLPFRVCYKSFQFLFSRQSSQRGYEESIDFPLSSLPNQPLWPVPSSVSPMCSCPFQLFCYKISISISLTWRHPTLLTCLSVLCSVSASGQPRCQRRSQEHA